MDDRNKLIIMCGLIGSGKTTWIKEYLQEHPDTLVISKDDIRRMLHGGEYIYDSELEVRVQFIVDDTLAELNHLSRDIILDECHLERVDRLLSGMDTENRFTTIVYFTPKDKKFHVDRRMTNSYGVSRAKWEEVYDEMISTLEPPTVDECDELIIIDY